MNRVISMINIFNDHPIGMPETGLSTDGRLLDRLQLLGTAADQHGDRGFEPIDLDRQPRRLERRASVGWSGNDQDREMRRRNGGKFEAGVGIGEPQGHLALEQADVELDRALEGVRLDKYARVGLKHHGHVRSFTERLQSYTAGLLTSAATVFGAVGATAFLATPSLAFTTVYDPWNYSQNLLEAARALQQIENQITSLQNEAQMLTNQARNLQNLPESSLQSITQSFSQTQNLINQAQGITYSIGNIQSQYGQLYSGANVSASDQALIQSAQARWQNSVSSFEDSLKVQAGVVANFDATRNSISSLVTSSQSAVGALQATQAGNQLIALQNQQLADLIAVVTAQSRAQTIEAARTTANQDQANLQFQRFLVPGAASSTSVQMFH